MRWHSGKLEKGSIKLANGKRIELGEGGREDLENDWPGFESGPVLFVHDGLEIAQIFPYPKDVDAAIRRLRELGFAKELEKPDVHQPLADLLAEYYASDQSDERARADRIYVHRKEDFEAEQVVRAVFERAGLGDRVKEVTEELSAAGGAFGFRGREVKATLATGQEQSGTIYELAGLVTSIINPLLEACGSPVRYHKLGVVGEQLGGVYLPLSGEARQALREIFVPTI